MGMSQRFYVTDKAYYKPVDTMHVWDEDVAIMWVGSNKSLYFWFMDKYSELGGKNDDSITGLVITQDIVDELKEAVRQGIVEDEPYNIKQVIEVLDRLVGYVNTVYYEASY